MLKKKTIKQCNIELLESKGWRQDLTTRVSRYTVYSKPDVDYHYYLGKMGAVRKGRTVGESYSVKLKIDEVKATVNSLSPDTGLELKTTIKPEHAVTWSEEHGGSLRMHELAEDLAQIAAMPEDEQRPDPSHQAGMTSNLSAQPINGNANSPTSPLATALQASIDLMTLPTPELLKRRCEDPDQEVRKIAHHELVRRGYTGVGMVEEWGKAVTA